MTADAQDGLAARGAGVPAPLIAHIRSALDATDGSEAPLLDAAVTCLRRSFTLAPRRKAALDLLAADALLTWACEDAAQESDGEWAERSDLMMMRLAALLEPGG